MRVHEGTSYEQTDSSWQKPEVELDEADYERALVEWGVTAEQAARIPLILKYQLLSAIGRQMLVMHQLHMRFRDTRWVESEGKAAYQAINAELQGLIAKIKG